MVLEFFNVKDPIVDFYIFFCYNIIEKKRMVIKMIDRILKDRLDFGFDSIYFRYAEAIVELSFYKEREKIKNNKPFSREEWAHTKLSHFWNCLEQLTRAHSVSEEPKIIPTFTLKDAKIFQEFAKKAQEATGGF